MSIKKFYLSNFKSIKNEICIEFKENLNLLLGLNGSGKSNILQALSLLNSPDEIRYDEYAHEDNADKDNIVISLGLTFDNFCLSNKNRQNNIFNYIFDNIGFWYKNSISKYSDFKDQVPIIMNTHSELDKLCNILKEKLFEGKLDCFTFLIQINKNNSKDIKFIFEDSDLISKINNDPLIIDFIDENSKLSKENKCIILLEDNKLIIEIKTETLKELLFDINSFINIKILKSWEKELPTSLTWSEYQKNFNKYSFYRNLIFKVARLDINDIEKLKNDEQLRYKSEQKIKEKLNDFLKTYWNEFTKNKKIIVRLDETKISILIALKNDKFWECFIKVDDNNWPQINFLIYFDSLF